MPDLFNHFYRDKRILITGHTGFKGSWLSLWLNKLGAQIIGYSLSPPTQPNLFDICRLRNKLNSISGDIRDLNKIKKVFIKYQPELVFHLAAQSLVRESYKNPQITYDTNVMGTINLLEAVRNSHSVKATIIVSSDKCYRNNKLDQAYEETDNLGGLDPYSSSKSCLEFVTNTYGKLFIKSLVTVRAGNVIGGGDWGQDRIVPDCIKALVKHKNILIRYPNAIRPWQHVLEPLYGYLLLGKKLYQKDSKFCGAWNFGAESKNSKQVKWLVKKIIQLWGKKISWSIMTKNNKFIESQCLKLNSNKAKKN